MNNQTELTKINVFLALAAPVVIGFVKTLLEADNFEVTQEGSGSDFAFALNQASSRSNSFCRTCFLKLRRSIEMQEPLQVR